MFEVDARGHPGAAHRIRYFDAMLGDLRKHLGMQISGGQRIHDGFAVQVKP